MRSSVLAALFAAAAGVSALQLDACPADRCGSPTAANACPLAPVLGASESGGSPEKLFVANESPRPARLLRVDETGAEQEHALLPPAGRLTLNTAQGVVWRARSLQAATGGLAASPTEGKLLMEHKVSPIRIEGCECPLRKAPACNRPPFRGYRTSWDPVVFENSSPHALELTWLDTDCEEALEIGASTVLPPFASVRFIATYGHTFRAHALGRSEGAPGALLRQHTIGDLLIPDCEEAAQAKAQGTGAVKEAEALVQVNAEASYAASTELLAANNALRLRLEVVRSSLRTAKNATHTAAIVASSSVSKAASVSAASDMLVALLAPAGGSVPGLW
mmetsp:Transcript_8253/g.21106  ORF Transcript_8253/g.21106 Transcript_8253/m.21106 type:complete len:335 (-) Transcript_8253:114-1118(-)